MAVQNGSTCILLTWTADSSAHAYIIYYNGSNGYSKSDEINNKWKNHFYKMKGDVGMSGHEKERKQEDAYTKIQTHS